MRPLVSILIPCYNAEQSIGRAIETALEQTWPEKEVIVVDDGSADASVEIIHGFGERIRWETGPNNGGNAARNLLMELARGEWLQFLDADDYLLPEKLNIQLSEAGDIKHYDILISPVIVERTVDRNKSRTVTRIDPEFDLFTQWILWHLPQTGGALWRREALLALGGWKNEQPCCQEHELYLRALKAGLRFCNCPTAAAVHRQWSTDTVSTRNPRQVVYQRSLLLDTLQDWMTGTNRWKTQHQASAAKVCFEMARTLARFDLDEAARYHADRNRRGLIRLDGNAAPFAYRATYILLGFRGAEQIAKMTRFLR